MIKSYVELKYPRGSSIFKCIMVEDSTGTEYRADLTAEQFRIAQLTDIFKKKRYDMKLIEEYGDLRFSQGQTNVYDSMER